MISEFDSVSRKNEEESEWGKGFALDRGKGSQEVGTALGTLERPEREKSEDVQISKKERIENKVLFFILHITSYQSMLST